MVPNSGDFQVSAPCLPGCHDPGNHSEKRGNTMSSHSTTQNAARLASLPHGAAASKQQANKRISMLRALLGSSAGVCAPGQSGSSREFLAKNRQTGGE
jgi:hypothetical protein